MSTLLLQAAPAEAGEILWDRQGVPHVYGKTIEEVVWGYGYAQLEQHAEQLLLNVAAARGRRAEYFGAGPASSNIENDQLILTVGVPQLAERWLADSSPRQRAWLEAFVAGANAYGERHGDTISPAIRQVLPLKATDPLAVALWTQQYGFMTREAMARVQAWKAGREDSDAVQAAPEHGSNAWAVAPSRMVEGNAVLVGNPHLLWGASAPAAGGGAGLPGPRDGMLQWTEAHLIVGDPETPTINVSGASFLASPILTIAFNDYLGWSHTVNWLQNADVFELTLTEGGYVFDGGVRPLEQAPASLKVCEAGQDCTQHNFTIYRSAHGPVVARKGGKALALRVAGLDASAQIEQYWDMAASRDLQGFTAAFSRLQMPYFNVVYADRDGHILYAYGGRAPVRKGGTYQDWSRILPGDDPSLIWDRTLTWDELPRTLDPIGGFVQNSNDAPWTSSFPQVLRPADYPSYLARNDMELRPQNGALFLQSKLRFTVDDLARGKRSTRMLMADRVLPDLLSAAQSSEDPMVCGAAEVLRNWDRESGPDSRGAVLFERWYAIHSAAMRAAGQPGIYRQPWTPDQPLTTPMGLVDANAAVASLAEAARQVQEAYGRLDPPWGEVYRVTLTNRDADYLNPRTVVDLPANGSDNPFGGLHNMRYLPPGPDGRRLAVGGEGYLQIVEFTPRGPRAWMSLSYGASTRPGSPHVADQVEAFLSGDLAPAARTRAEVEAQTVNRETY